MHSGRRRERGEEESTEPEKARWHKADGLNRRCRFFCWQVQRDASCNFRIGVRLMQYRTIQVRGMRGGTWNAWSRTIRSFAAVSTRSGALAAGSNTGTLSFAPPGGITRHGRDNPNSMHVFSLYSCYESHSC